MNFRLAASFSCCVVMLANLGLARQSTLWRFVVTGAEVTYARGVDSQGGVAGSYVLPGGSLRGFLRDSSGLVQHVDWPGGTITAFEGVTEAGVAVGFAVGPGSDGPVEFYGSSWTAYSPPPQSTVFLQGGNDSGLRVGHLVASDGSEHGVLFTDGVPTGIDFPGAYSTELEDVNALGLIVGNYRSSSFDQWHGFTYDLNTGVFTSLDMPGTAETRLCGLNDLGDIVGEVLPMGSGSRRAVSYLGGQWSELELFGVLGRSNAAGIGNDGSICGDYYGQFQGSASVLGFLIDPTGSGPSRYCQSAPNSSGDAAGIHFVGTTSISANDLTLEAGPAPTGVSGIFFYGSSRVEVPFGDGFLCVGSPQYRLGVTSTDGVGFALQSFDATAPPSAGGQVTAGSRWYFQFWFRDTAAGGAGFNTSEGLVVDFTP